MSWLNRSNDRDEFAEAIRPELQELAVPSPSSELLERVIASRSAGARVILPDAAALPTVVRRRILMPALIAAALLLVAVPLMRSPRGHSVDGEASSLSRIATEWLPGSIAFAQGDASRGVRNAPPMSFVRPGNLKPMRLEYRRTWRDSAQTETGRINGVMTVKRIVLSGKPAYIVVSRNEGARNGRRLFTIDSVAVAGNNLRLLHRTALERPYLRYDQITIEQSFRGDSVLGRMRVMKNGALSAQRPIARNLAASSGPYIVDALAPIILGTANVRAGWRGSASMLGWAVRDDDVFMRIDLRVDGEDVVTVPAGRFDCWRLSIRFPGGAVTYWARKSDGVGVRTIEREASGAVREVVLVKAVT